MERFNRCCNLSMLLGVRVGVCKSSAALKVKSLSNLGMFEKVFDVCCVLCFSYTLLEREKICWGLWKNVKL